MPFLLSPVQTSAMASGSGPDGQIDTVTADPIDLFGMTAGSGPVGPGTYEDNSPAIKYTGPWSRVKQTKASGGTYTRSSVTKATASLAIIGATDFSVVTSKAKNQGIEGILVDGRTAGTFDGYGTTHYGVALGPFYLADTLTHTISLQVSGTKNRASSGYFATLDRINVHKRQSVPTYTPTNTPSPTNTQTWSPTSTETPTNTVTGAPTSTLTNTPTNTATPTNTFTPTNSPTPTNTATSTPSNTPTSTATNAPTRTPTSTITPVAGPVYPLKANGRYLVDQNSVPFLIEGDSPWSLIVQLTNADVNYYLANRQAKGFNAIIVNLLEHKFATYAPNTTLSDCHK